VEIPVEELEFGYARSGGPGGQNVNKVNSKVVLRWSVVNSRSLTEDVRARFIARYGSRLTGDGELIITSQRFRDQTRNAQECLAKLAAMVASVVVPPKPRRPTRPTAGSQRRRVEGKREQGEKKRLRRRPQGND
jgi:ribosome-associated protein